VLLYFSEIYCLIRVFLFFVDLFAKKDLTANCQYFGQPPKVLSLSRLLHAQSWTKDLGQSILEIVRRFDTVSRRERRNISCGVPEPAQGEQRFLRRDDHKS